MVKEVRLTNVDPQVRIAQFVPCEGADLSDVVRLAQIFVRKHGVGGNASLPDGRDGEQNGFAIDAVNGIVQIRSKCEGPSARRALLANLEQNFHEICTWL